MIRQIFKKMLLTQISAALAVSVCSFVDSIIIGRHLGAEAIAAFGLSISVVTLFAAIGGSIAAGAQIIASKALGLGDKKELEASYATAITVGTIVSVVCMAGVIVFADPLSILLGASPGSDIQHLTRDYLIGYIIGCPAFVGFQIINPYLQLYGKRKIVLISILLMTIIDIIGDYMNVYIFHQGTFGMGLASSVSYYFALFAAILYICKKGSDVKFSLRNFRSDVLTKIFTFGSVYAVYQICRAAFTVFSNRMVIQVGGNELLSAYSVVRNIYTICISFGMGIAATTLLLAGVAYGEKNKISIEETIKSAIYYSVIIQSVIIAIVIIFAVPICSLFMKHNPQIVTIASDLLRIFIFSILFFSINASLRSFYQGLQKTMLAQLICMLQNLVCPMTIALLVNKILPHSGKALMGAFVFGEIITTIGIMVYCRCKTQNPKSMAELFSLNCVEKSCTDPIIIDLKSIDDAIAASSKVGHAYKEYYPDGKNGYPLSLMVEEVAVNRFTHGIIAKNKEPRMEVRFLRLKDSCHLEFRDDGIAFDPCSYYDMYKDTESACDHIGLKLVMKIADDVNYVYTVGLNSLTIFMEEKHEDN